MEEKTNEIVRYSDADLAEFKAIVEKKLEKAKEELQYLQEQILEISENSSDDHGGDWMDDSNINNDIEFLNNMAIRQRKYVQELENALVRIRNKTYGVCMVTGKLIDKRRLLAVPTATKSVEAKAIEATAVGKKQKEEEDEEEKLERKKKLSKAKTEPKIITKVIKKPTKPAPKPVDLDDDDDDLVLDDDDLGLDEDLEISSTDDELEDAAGSEEQQDFDDDDDNDDI
jgi:RNA polymerase-binding transcription factor DksA